MQGKHIKTLKEVHTNLYRQENFDLADKVIDIINFLNDPILSNSGANAGYKEPVSQGGAVAEDYRRFFEKFMIQFDENGLAAPHEIMMIRANASLDEVIKRDRET